MNSLIQFFARSVFVLAFIFSINTLATPADLATEKADFVRVFSSGDLAAMKEKAVALEWKGLSDPQIFDPIEAQVLANMNVVDKVNLDNVAWLIKALGFSGNKKYMPTLYRVELEGAEKLRKHATASIENLEKHSKLNAVLSKGLASAPAGQLDQSRAMNMLRSGDAEMVRTGVKLVYYHRYPATSADKALLDEVKKLMLASYNTASDEVSIDSVGWMCKTLGATDKPEYRAAVEQVAANASNPKIKGWAKKALGVR